MPFQPLQTKLYIPPPRPNLVPRPRLIQRLAEGLSSGHRLVLISAPAGFGKTTLLGHWVAGSGRPVGWVSLNKSDNDPMRFWAYFITALRAIPDLGEASVGETALTATQSPQPPPMETLLTGLINEITAISPPFALVLDDFHVISNQQVNGDVTWLLDHLPPQMHLIISTRADPPWPLARLRVHGDMTELRASDLRFTPEEVAAYLNDVMELNLSPENVAALEERTEGWIAGLQMAAISMQARRQTQGIHDASEFVKAFTGSNRFILDYLVEEVLDQQPRTIQEFLLKTSVLDRLTAPLCNAVIGNQQLATKGCTKPASQQTDDSQICRFADLRSQEILEYLERANLFVVPLDERRQWYRYHHLFADLLRNRLEQTRPDQVPSLHLRASEWYEQNEMIVDALNHALVADDVERVARLVERNALAVINHAELATVLKWLDALPEKVVRPQPWLCVAQSWLLAHTSQLCAAELLLQDIENRLDGLDQPSERQRIAGHVAAIRAFVAILNGEKDRATELAHEALERLPEKDLAVRGYTMSTLGGALRWSGDPAAAAQATAEAIVTSREASDIHVTVDALCDLLLSQILQGQLHKAADTFQDVLQLANEYVKRGRRQPPVIGLAYAHMSVVLREQNNLDAAIRHARKGIELCKQWGQTDILLTGLVNLAEALRASGDIDGALDAIREAKRITRDLSPFSATYAEAYEARMRLAQGDVAAAVHWAASWESKSSSDDMFDFQYEFGHIMLAQVLIAQGERQPGGSLDRASGLLRRLLQGAEAAGRTGRVITILVLQALTLQARGKVDQALTVLKRALSLAEPEGYVRTFVDQGTPMSELLHLVATQGIAVDYATRLLAALQEQGQENKLGRPAPFIPQPLVEPLTERELDVLRLLTTSLSSIDIAKELFVEVSTVRSHTRNIYRKLDAHRRSEAVQRAKELELL